MSIPPRRRSSSRRDQRRMHIFLKNPSLTVCSKCKSKVLPHTVCQNCGYYNGREVIDVLGKLSKKEKKKREKETEAREKEEKQEKNLSMEELSKK